MRNGENIIIKFNLKSYDTNCNIILIVIQLKCFKN